MPRRRPHKRLKPSVRPPPAPTPSPEPVAAQWLRLENLAAPLSLGEAGAQLEAHLAQAAARRLQLGGPPPQVRALRIVRRALDARHGQVGRSFTVDVAVSLPAAAVQNLRHRNLAKPASRYRPKQLTLPAHAPCRAGPRPVVVGAGPAGLFAALTLAEAGWAPILVERGRGVEQRGRDVAALYARGTLQPDSNVCYGEGGAGTYSDGKLYTRLGDERVDAVLHKLVALGAKADILVHNRPHLGTDKLVGLMQAMRARLRALGTTICFDCRLEDMAVQRGRLHRLRLSDGGWLDAPHVVLATGHSARAVWHLLARQGVALEARPFAMGLRVEHPQALINEARYGAKLAAQKILPAADYRLVHHDPVGAEPGAPDPRAAFSFCMCPGGVVVTTPTTEQALCINGMSHASRNGRYANSALVASVGPQDFARAGYTGPFAGADLQDACERAAYLAGGGAFVAPAARVSDFLAGKVSQDLPATSYRRGIVPADLARLYPAPLVATLKRALLRFDRMLPGFVSDGAVLLGVETRTASPVRVPRSACGQASQLLGLYPAGEGMGYGGGILSAAVDGLRAAQALLLAQGATFQPAEPAQAAP